MHVGAFIYVCGLFYCKKRIDNKSKKVFKEIFLKCSIAQVRNKFYYCSEPLNLSPLSVVGPYPFIGEFQCVRNVPPPLAFPV